VKPIPVSEFSGHAERLHADRDKLFEMEYEVSTYTMVWERERESVCGMCVCVCTHALKQFQLVNDVNFFRNLLFLFVQCSCVMS
jgi:hypothetical protein